jgi:hypothetical protein
MADLDGEAGNFQESKGCWLLTERNRSLRRALSMKF